LFAACDRDSDDSQCNSYNKSTADADSDPVGDKYRDLTINTTGDLSSYPEIPKSQIITMKHAILELCIA